MFANHLFGQGRGGRVGVARSVLIWNYEATFFEGKSRSPLPHDTKQLAMIKNMDSVTAPRVATRSGRPAQTGITRDFSLPNQPKISQGVMVQVTPRATRDGITYTTQITQRSFEHYFHNQRGPTGSTFTAREIYSSGTLKSGGEVWFDFPLSRDGYATCVRLVFNNK